MHVTSTRLCFGKNLFLARDFQTADAVEGCEDVLFTFLGLVFVLPWAFGRRVVGGWACLACDVMDVACGP